MRTRAPLVVILAATLLASCGGRPDVAVTIAGHPVPTVLSSATEGTACSTTHGDAFPRELPQTTASAPVAIRFDAAESATAIRGFIYDVAASSGAPAEEFTLPGRSGTYTPRTVVIGRTYSVTVNVVWSVGFTNGEATHAFRLLIAPP